MGLVTGGHDDMEVPSLRQPTWMPATGWHQWSTGIAVCRVDGSRASEGFPASPMASNDRQVGPVDGPQNDVQIP